MGAVLAAKGSIWGLAVGVLLYFILNCTDDIKHEIVESQRESAALDARSQKIREAVFKAEKKADAGGKQK